MPEPRRLSKEELADIEWAWTKLLPPAADDSAASIYLRKLLAHIAALEAELATTKEACRAAVRYDKAMRKVAENHDELTERGTITRDDLDEIYMDWIRKARSALGPEGKLQEWEQWLAGDTEEQPPK